MLRYMKRLLIVTVLTLVLSAGCTDRGPNVPDRPVSEGGIMEELDHDFFQELFLQIGRNASKKGPRVPLQIKMYTPEGSITPISGGQPKPVPLLVLLPPQDGRAYYFFDHGLKQLANELIAEGAIKPMAIACVENDPIFGGYFYAGRSAPAGYYDTLIGSSLLEHLYNWTLGILNDSLPVGIGGVGMGAYGAFRAALMHKGVFTSVSATDGPLDFDGPNGDGGFVELFDDALMEQGLLGGTTEDPTITSTWRCDLEGFDTLHFVCDSLGFDSIEWLCGLHRYDSLWECDSLEFDSLWQCDSLEDTVCVESTLVSIDSICVESTLVEIDTVCVDPGLDTVVWRCDSLGPDTVEWQCDSWEVDTLGDSVCVESTAVIDTICVDSTAFVIDTFCAKWLPIISDTVCVESTLVVDTTYPPSWRANFDSSGAWHLSRLFIGGALAFSPHDTLIDTTGIYQPTSDTSYRMNTIPESQRFTIDDTMTLITEIVKSDQFNFDFHFPFDSSGKAYNLIWNMWLENNLERILADSVGHLDDVKMWIGTTSEFEFGNYRQQTLSWIETLRNQSNFDSTQLQVKEYIGYPGNPATNDQYIYDLMRDILIFHSKAFEED